ncbi:radical SAM protein [Actinoallomurus sp. CA-150999]|uniref:radical SAM protein n=1 Tax=Actinoallomurus sp. CA-150999 TaxID=3239887 RepID=UPI003D93CBAF
MIREIAHVRHIRMLYLQLLYHCNFACQHCFHGELLKAEDSYSEQEVGAMLRYFRTNYGLAAVTLLGGEPLLHPGIVEVCREAKALGLAVEICTNGHFGFQHQVEKLAPYLDKLRISLEGLQPANDRIRHPGSFVAAMRTIEAAHRLDIPLGATMTVTATNLHDVVPLARLLEQRGVQELKLHCLRPVGNATQHPELFITDTARYTALHEAIRHANLGIELRYDADLAPHPHSDACATNGNRAGQDLDRIEADPRGGLTMSCKAVGRHAHAFRWDSSQETVVYEPHAHDELIQHIPDVVYRST